MSGTLLLAWVLVIALVLIGVGVAQWTGRSRYWIESAYGYTQLSLFGPSPLLNVFIGVGLIAIVASLFFLRTNKWLALAFMILAGGNTIGACWMIMDTPKWAIPRWARPRLKGAWILRRLIYASGGPGGVSYAFAWSTQGEVVRSKKSVE